MSPSTAHGSTVPTSVTGAERGSADGAERTLGQLVSDASRDLSAIVRSEVALAKAELTTEAKTAGQGAVLFVVAGVLAFLALILLLIAAAFGLVEAGVDRWLAFLIVAGVLLLIGTVVGLVGLSRVKKVGGPERTVRTTKQTVDALKPGKPHPR